MSRSIPELKKLVLESVEKRRSAILALADDLLNMPEQGYREVRTSARVKAEMERMGLAPRCGLAVSGLRADLPCG
ncbi:MAG: hypothetical protein J6331_00585, partial [Lentisphaeria bacterium]|nr:hypothetical protein [Lentisphaeria bacterium]